MDPRASREGGFVRGAERGRSGVTRYPRSFSFRLTEADGDRLDGVAAAEGTTSGEWARRVVSTSLSVAYERRALRRRVANADLLRALLGELGRLGNNLNQIAAKLNAGMGADDRILQQVSGIRAELKVLVQKITTALGGTEKP